MTFAIFVIFHDFSILSMTTNFSMTVGNLMLPNVSNVELEYVDLRLYDRGCVIVMLSATSIRGKVHKPCILHSV